MANNGDIERFMAKVSISPNGCWEWLAGKKGGGYGVFFLNGKLRGAHRAALYLFKGQSLDTPLDAMHSCDNPACVNPDHLSYGSRTENMVDASKKGRIVRVQDWRGQLNPKAKLSPEQTASIVEMLRAGVVSIKAIADLFSVSKARIHQIGWSVGIVCDVSRAEAAKRARLARMECKHGHALVDGNVRINSAGARVCLLCEKAARVVRKARRAEEAAK